MNAGVSAFRSYDPLVWAAGLDEPLTCTSADTPSSTIFSYNGYRHLSVSGGYFQCPPEAAG